MNNALAAVIGYLLGSIPFGYILVKLFLRQDVRSIGSGNIGATNVARSGKKGLAIATLALDALKGYVAVKLAWAMGVQPNSAIGFNIDYTPAALAAIFAMLGHVFPVWLKFKGGKAVATGLGVFLALSPRAVAICLIVFIALVLLTRFVSLGSIIAAAVFPIATYFLRDYHNSFALLGASIFAALLIIVKHHENISRLLAGTENKFGAAKA